MLTRTLFLALGAGVAAAQVAPEGGTPAPAKSLWFGDLDADGRDDVFVVQPDGATRLLMNQGDGSFLDVTARVGLGATAGAHMAVFGDANGDGRVDLFLPAWNAASRLMIQAEDGTFLDGTEAAGLPRHAEPVDAAWRDVDGDGHLDLALTTALDDLVYRGNGRGVFEKLDLGLETRVPRERPETLAAARAARDLPPIGTGTGQSSAPGAPDFQPICITFIQDQANPGVCMMASSDPTLGLLYPISSDWFVASGSGFTGLGTTAPTSRLHVAGDARVTGTVIVTGGGAPFQVSSTTLNTNLNADLLDGLDASAFAQMPLGGGDITDGSLTGADIQDGSLGSADLGANSVGSSELAASSVGTSEVADNSLTAADLAPSSVGSSEIANGGVVNADLGTGSVTTEKIKDGTIQSVDFAPGAIDGGAPGAGTVFDVHVNGAAGIQGAKVVPDFGTQNLTTDGTGAFGSGGSTPWKVRGDGFADAHGYLGAQGASDFDGTVSADWSGQELGVVGISVGASNTDNVGVVGHSNNIGVRGEYSGAPTTNFGALGLDGIGVYGTGTTLAADFDGSVVIDGRLDLDFNTTFPVLDVSNAFNGNCGRFTMTGLTTTGSALIGDHDGLGTAGSFTQSNAAAISAAVFSSSKGTSSSHRTLHAVNGGGGAGQAALIDINQTGATGISAWVRNRGTGTALYVETEGNPTRTVHIDKNVQAHNAGRDMIQVNVLDASAGSQFVEFERGTDVEFRVDVDGDVFADGAYTGPADFAEMIRVTDGASSVEAGDVVVIDPDEFRSVEVSTESHSRLVAGVYSTRPGFVGSEREFVGAIGPDGERMSLKRSDMAEMYDEVPVAVVGIVPCKVSSENGPIRPGDLLVTSNVPGHAMVDNDPPVGTVVGKALEAFDGQAGSTGVIRILVTLQ